MEKKYKDEFCILNSRGEREITLKKICTIAGLTVPQEFEAIQDDILSDVVVRQVNVTEKSCLIRIGTGTAKGIEDTVARGARVIFVSRNEYDAEGYEGKGYPVIPVDNIADLAGKFFSYIRNLNPVRTAAVTGTCGKTTTMKFLGSIVPNAFNTYMNEGNANSYFAVADHIMNGLTPEKEVYIQEVGAASSGSVEKSAAMLNVDAFVLLNVFDHHSDDYGSKENILHDKASFIRHMNEDGVAVVNFDDEMIAGYDFGHKVISFGIDTERDVEYRGCNITQNGSVLEMDIEHAEGSTHIAVNILGTHNAYNALAAFALSKWLGMLDEQIAEGLKAYRSIGFRQNFRHVGGYDLLLDCYNCNEDSLKADIKTLREINTAEGRKKIAVISAENRLGDKAEEISYAMGQRLDFSGIDKVIVVGNDDADPDEAKEMCYGRPLYEGIKAAGYENVVCVTETRDLEKELQQSAEIGDVILFKGLYNLDFTVAVDNLYGTAISMNNNYYINRSKSIKNKQYRGRCFTSFDRVDISGVKKPGQRKFRIPDAVDGVPVHRIGNQLFKNNHSIRKIKFGSSLKHIGKGAFRNCINISRLVIPGNVKMIEEAAFEGCKGLKKLIIKDGVTHIEADAFKGCGLKEVRLPQSVKYVAETAFDTKCSVVYK